MSKGFKGFPRFKVLKSASCQDNPTQQQHRLPKKDRHVKINFGLTSSQYTFDLKSATESSDSLESSSKSSQSISSLTFSLAMRIFSSSRTTMFSKMWRVWKTLSLAYKRDSVPTKDHGLAYWQMYEHVLGQEMEDARRQYLRHTDPSHHKQLLASEFWKVHFHKFDTLLHPRYLRTSTSCDRLRRINNGQNTTSMRKVATVLFRNIHGDKIIIIIITKHDSLLKKILLTLTNNVRNKVSREKKWGESDPT
jgi:hypothetical protein